jgi:hypothetical protein
MEQRFTQEFFYGSAIAALTGLVFGLALHIPWEKHPGGPQILFSRAEAEEVVRPDSKDAKGAIPEADQIEVADQDTSPLPPDPLPVTRLAPQMFDVRPGAADEAERQAVDDLVADDGPPASSSDLTRPGP